MMSHKTQTLSRLLGATAISLLATTAIPQTNCDADFITLPGGCEPANAGSAVTIPVAANTETAVAPTTGAQGFVISINGNAIAGDTETASPIVKAARRTDVALANADVQVTFDGLGAVPRLDLEVVEINANGTATLQSALNYPAFVAKAEVRVIDLDAIGGPRTIGVTAMSPNGTINVDVPEGRNIVAVHRVYDAAGRYDETFPVSLAKAGGAGRAANVEEGIDNTARRRIPVAGGAITVRGSDVASGASVIALGEVVQPDRDGGFVIQRILPAGDYGVDVAVNGGAKAEPDPRCNDPAIRMVYSGDGRSDLCTKTGRS